MAESRAHRITPTPRPDGVDLHVDGYLRATLRDLLGVLDERPELLDDLNALYADPAPQINPYMPDRASRDERLLDQLVEALPTTIGLHRLAARRLGASLGWMTRRSRTRPLLSSLPSQQGRRAS